MPKAGKLVPSLFGGILCGLSLLMLAIRVGGPCLCCLSCIGGGVLASFLLVRNSKNSNLLPVEMGDGAITGLLSGLWGGLLATAIIAIFFLVMFHNPEFQAGFHQAVEEGLKKYPREQQEIVREYFKTPVFMILIMAGMNLVVCIFGSLVGGLIGVSLFERRKGTIQPPPPTYPGYPGYPGS